MSAGYIPKRSVIKISGANIIFSRLSISVIDFKLSLINWPRTIRRYSHSAYAADKITPDVAKSATQVLTLKIPTKVKNSPTKPDVPGKPTFAKVKNIKINA